MTETVKHGNARAFCFVEILERSEKPRTKGLTMVLDKGIGLYKARDLMHGAPYVDIIKLGWATPRLFNEKTIRDKIEIYKKNGIVVGNGGTLLEIIYSQGKVELFFDYCREIGIDIIEVSNGVLPITAQQKARIINMAHEKGFFVISEVGKKDPAEDRMLSIEQRIAEARSDLEAGAHYCIIEAREGGRNLGVYDDKGGLKEKMAKVLVEKIGLENIMFEAPEKSQQSRLILIFGPDVNLGNILPEDVIPLETLRRGIRGDTCGKV